MLITFNMGIGLVLIVDKEKAAEVKNMLGEVYEIGKVVAKEGLHYN